MRTFWPGLPDNKDEILTFRPDIGRERELEEIVQRVEWLEEMMEDAPSLKADTEPIRRPKIKRRAPRASDVTVRSSREAA